jgi:CheY-like chemotaxis protein
VTDGKKRVLVAEDDPAVLDVLRLMLEEGGYAVETVTDAAVLREFSHGYPDVLLLDIWMSGWDGAELCRALKQRDETRHLPILLCSANRDVERIARDAGADGFIAKPFDMDDLLLTVARHLENRPAPKC